MKKIIALLLHCVASDFGFWYFRLSLWQCGEGLVCNLGEITGIKMGF